jgi:hypothetical protein
VLDAIRTRVLEFALAIDERHPTAGEVGASDAASIPQREIHEIFNTTIGDASSRTVGDVQSVGTSMSHSGIKIFISHSSLDQGVAESLIDFLEAGLTAPRGTIRCTSVHGYKLEGGDDGPDVLRQDLNDCSVVLGLITPNSLRSAYVLMELGAAWALGRKAIPLLAPGTPRPDLGPFKDIHSLNIDVLPEMVSVFGTIAKSAGLQAVDDMPKVAARFEKLKTALASMKVPEVAAAPPASFPR